MSKSIVSEQQIRNLPCRPLSLELLHANPFADNQGKVFYLELSIRLATNLKDYRNQSTGRSEYNVFNEWDSKHSPTRRSAHCEYLPGWYAANILSWQTAQARFATDRLHRALQHLVIGVESNLAFGIGSSGDVSRFDSDIWLNTAVADPLAAR